MKRKPPIVADIKFNTRTLRKNPTEVESYLWKRLRNRNLGGFKFRRQHPYGRFIMDFYCSEARLGIELEGSVHDVPDVAFRDQLREQILKSSRIRLLKFRNEEIFSDVKSVMDRILTELHAYCNS